MQPPSAQLVDQATGKPAMLIDPTLEQRPEQGADRFESSRFVDAERRPLIALESQYANADATTAEDHRAHRSRRGKIAVGNGNAAGAVRGGRKDDAAPLIERLVHGVFEAGDELALLFEKGRVRHGQQTRSPSPVYAERHPVAVEAAGKIVDHRHRQGLEAGLLRRQAEHVESDSRPLQGLRVVAILAAQKQRLDPADSPVQLPQHQLQSGFRPLGDIEHHRPVHLSFEFHRIGDDHQRTCLSGEENAAPLAQALLSGRRQIGDVGLLGRPDGGRNESTAALLEQQQGRTHVGHL